MTETDKAIQAKFRFNGRKRNLPWYPRLGTRRNLAELFAELGFVSGVEVGTRQGVYAKVLCEHNPGLHLHCIDPWAAYGGSSQEQQDSRYRDAVEALAGHNATLIRKPSMDAVGQFEDGSLDFVFIDGNHLFDFAMMDIISWAPKVCKNGIVAVHDYHPFTGSDVIWAVNAYTHCHGISPWYVTREMEPTSFWVRT